MTWIVIALVAVAAAVVAWYVLRKRRTDALRHRFGPEYEHTVREKGDIAKAEAALEQRARRVERLHIKPLRPEDATRYSETWKRVQTRFVDDPKGAVTEDDRLVGEVMHDRGYPVGDFDQRVEDISVDHPNVVMHYRAARDIAEDHARGRAGTEELRQAMVHYRALFVDLLETAPATIEASDAPAEPRRTR
jgi:hypothetical protein